MSTVENGNKLEDAFYDYLCAQKSAGLLVYDAYPSELCKIHKKKKYYCREREANIEFDVVIELFRRGGVEPHLHVVFECKNHRNPIKERDVTDTSDKINRIFRHAVKGVLVASTRLQSGAEKIARKRKMGIVKYVENGFEIVADRTGGTFAEKKFLEAQFFGTQDRVKSLKFSACYNGGFIGSIDQLLRIIAQTETIESHNLNYKPTVTVPFISNIEVQRSAKALLEQVGYQSGAINLSKICSTLSLNLIFTGETVRDDTGQRILGSASFERKTITINSHENKQRERFTIGHEIGHFHLGHDRYLRSEKFLEQDLLLSKEGDKGFNLHRLEYQANIFSSELLLPTDQFLNCLEEVRLILGLVNKGHGHLFVDDQPCNYGPFNQLLAEISGSFDVSNRAIEVKLKRMGLLNDQRRSMTKISGLR